VFSKLEKHFDKILRRGGKWRKDHAPTTEIWNFDDDPFPVLRYNVPESLGLAGSYIYPTTV